MEKLTPDEIAYDTAIVALYTRFNNISGRSAEHQNMRDSIARVHNMLVDMNGGNGVRLPERNTPVNERMVTIPFYPWAGYLKDLGDRIETYVEPNTRDLMFQRLDTPDQAREKLLGLFEKHEQ